jgi:hypothetical protein
LTKQRNKYVNYDGRLCVVWEGDGSVKEIVCCYGCRHSGFVFLGQEFFERMIVEFDGTPGGWLERYDKSFLVNNKEMGFGLCLEFGLAVEVEILWDCCDWNMVLYLSLLQVLLCQHLHHSSSPCPRFTTPGQYYFTSISFSALLELCATYWGQYAI